MCLLCVKLSYDCDTCSLIAVMCGILLLLHGVDVAQHTPPQVTVCWTLRRLRGCLWATLLCLALAFHNLSTMPQASPPPSCQTVSRTGHLHTLQRRGPDSLSTEQVRTCRVTLHAGKPAGYHHTTSIYIQAADLTLLTGQLGCKCHS